METITIKQGYIAMYKFLQELQQMTQSDDLAGFLGGMAFLEDGTTGNVTKELFLVFWQLILRKIKGFGL